MPSLTINERATRGVTIVDLSGGILIGGTNRDLHNAIKRLVQEGKNKIVLNMAKVTRIDSSGLGELVAGFATLKSNNGALKLLGLPANVVDLMTITKLYTVFDIYEEEIDAVNSFDEAHATREKSFDAPAADPIGRASIH